MNIKRRIARWLVPRGGEIVVSTSPLKEDPAGMAEKVNTDGRY